MFVHQPDGIAPLEIIRQVAKEVALGLVRILNAGIQFRIIKGTDWDQWKLVFGGNVPLIFQLIIIIGRQEGKLQKAEQQLEIRPADGKDEGGIPGYRSVQGQADITRSNSKPSAEFFLVPFYLRHFEIRT